MITFIFSELYIKGLEKKLIALPSKHFKAVISYCNLDQSMFWFFLKKHSKYDLFWRLQILIWYHYFRNLWTFKMKYYLKLEFFLSFKVMNLKKTVILKFILKNVHNILKNFELKTFPLAYCVRKIIIRGNYSPRVTKLLCFCFNNITVSHRL